MSLIATLEGLDGVTSCVAVAPNSHGNCQCVRQGPAERPKRKPSRFQKLCAEQNLPVRIGHKSSTPSIMMNGLEKGEKKMAKRRKRRSMSLSLPPIEDIGFAGGLDGLFSKDMAIDFATVAGGGAAAGMAYKFITKKFATKDATGTPRLFFSSLLSRILLAAGMGVLLGRAVWGDPDGVPTRMRRNAAMGILGALGNEMAIDIFNTVTKDDGGKGWLDGLGDADYDPSAALMAAPEDELLGLGDTFVEERRSLLAGSEVDVSEPDETQLAWLG